MKQVNQDCFTIDRTENDKRLEQENGSTFGYKTQSWGIIQRRDWDPLHSQTCWLLCEVLIFLEISSYCLSSLEVTKNVWRKERYPKRHEEKSVRDWKSNERKSCSQRERQDRGREKEAEKGKEVSGEEKTVDFLTLLFSPYSNSRTSVQPLFPFGAPFVFGT